MMHVRTHVVGVMRRSRRSCRERLSKLCQASIHNCVSLVIANTGTRCEVWSFLAPPGSSSLCWPPQAKRVLQKRKKGNRRSQEEPGGSLETKERVSIAKCGPPWLLLVPPRCAGLLNLSGGHEKTQDGKLEEAGRARMKPRKMRVSIAKCGPSWLLLAPPHCAGLLNSS